MDLISIEEMLWHYVSRMNLALENIEQHQKDLQELIMLLDESYKTEVGQKLHKKLEECEEDTKKVQTHFEDALYFIRRQINELEELVVL